MDGNLGKKKSGIFFAAFNEKMIGAGLLLHLQGYLRILP